MFFPLRFLMILILVLVVVDGKHRKKFIPKRLPFLSNSEIEYINNINTTWKAGRNFPANKPRSFFKKLIMGVEYEPEHKKLPKKLFDKKLLTDLPENYDPREKYPNCKTINSIRDQSDCASAWAFSVVESFSDRICIHNNHTGQTGPNHNPVISAIDLISCCETCGSGCKGGNPSAAWEYLKNTGAVSGGEYGDLRSCRPYPFTPCGEGTSRPCGSEPQSTPTCAQTCIRQYRKPYQEDKHFVSKVYSIDADEDDIMNEIYTVGPVSATMEIYEDFLNYKSGVYQRLSSHEMGVHAVKILGWGVENGVKYWLCANSWRPVWGDKGFFKILRGNNECRIESDISAGEPA